VTASAPTGELEVLATVCRRLEQVGVDYMLTGSFAMAFYATPRMTRDIDLVVALAEPVIADLVTAFQSDFYIDADDAREAVRSERLFNLMHLSTGIKVDLIVRKRAEYRQVEFARRQRVVFGDVATWIVACEDLILSKLIWAREGGSELQRRDVKSLLGSAVDQAYLSKWAGRLGVSDLLREVSK
jgi:hypothetical protein